MFKALKQFLSELSKQINNSNGSPSVDHTVESSYDNASHCVSTPTINPANGMPMMPGGIIDVLGNPYGTDCHSSGIGFDGSDPFDTHSSSFNDFGGGSFHDPF